MSKKKTDALCLTCGKALRPKWRACPRCGRESLAHRSARKAAAPTPFIGKGGRAKCAKCLTVAKRRGQACCTRCGSALLYAVNAAPSPVGDLLTKAAGSPDPVEREYYWRLAHPDNGGGVA